MNQKQYAAFMAYWGLGGDRSLERLHREWATLLPKLVRPPCLKTLKLWSSKFKWQEEMIKMDDDANKKLFDKAVNAARESRIDILKVFRIVVLKFAIGLRNDPLKEITSNDVATFWRMARIEMGLAADHGKIDHDVSQNLADIIKEELFLKAPNESKDKSDVKSKRTRKNKK